VADVIEFRVFGNVGSNVPVFVKYTNSQDGLTALTTISLPYVASVRNLADSIFLDLEATSTPACGCVSSCCPLSGSYLQAQVFVNGKLFREAFASNISPLQVTANGTFRRGDQ